MDVSYRRHGKLTKHFSSPPTGFSLIEVLITLFVISIGLLGLAGLQIQGLRCSHSAILRTHAVSFASEIAEQLHASVMASRACKADPCAAPGISDAVLEDWQARILGSLPNGKGVVAYGTSSATVTVEWDDHEDARAFNLSLVL